MTGVSMGGMGALFYLRSKPQELNGVVLLAPFLGEEVIDEILSSGGLMAWRPGEYLPQKEWSRWLWDGIKQAVKAGRVPIFLAYGRQDRHLKGQQLLASVLPERRTLR